MPLYPRKRRKPRLASRIDAPIHRRTIEPSRHRLTLRVMRRMLPFRFSMGLVVESVLGW